MSEEYNDDVWRSWPDVFRRVLERLEHAVPLPAGTPAMRSLASGREPRASAEDIGEREPGTDVIESSEAIFITIELPGVSRRDIDIAATETALVIRVNSPNYQYHREIELPAPVHVNTIVATFKNGVLDVVLEKGSRARRIPVR